MSYTNEDEELIMTARVAAHEVNDQSATIMEKGIELALFLEIRKWCIILATMKQKLGMAIIYKPSLGEIDEDVEKQLAGAEILIGYGIIKSRRFGVKTKTKDLTVDKWYSFWNGWWVDLNKKEREEITNEGDFDYDVATKLAPSISWTEIVQPLGFKLDPEADIMSSEMPTD